MNGPQNSSLRLGCTKNHASPWTPLDELTDREITGGHGFESKTKPCVGNKIAGCVHFHCGLAPKFAFQF